MTWDWISFVIGVLCRLGVLTVSIFFGWDEWFK